MRVLLSHVPARNCQDFRPKRGARRLVTPRVTMMLEQMFDSTELFVLACAVGGRESGSAKWREGVAAMCLFASLCCRWRITMGPGLDRK